MLSKTGRFQRADRILCTRDFTRAVKTGKRGVSKGFVVVIAARADAAVGEPGEERSRLGVTVGKRVGNSVIRNRVKRCIREWFRHAREGLPGGSDIVVIARRTTPGLSNPEIAAALDQTIRSLIARRGGQTTAVFR